MLDIKFVRENLDAVETAMKNRNSSFDKEKFVKLDEARRDLIAKAEDLQAKRNAASKSIGELMRNGKRNEAEAAKDDVRKINDELESAGKKRDEAEAALKQFIMAVPNMPHETTPVGADENDNPEIRRWGDIPNFDFKPLAHWDLGPNLNIIDFERGVKLAKSRFYVLGGLGAKLERSLINFMIDTQTSRGYKE